MKKAISLALCLLIMISVCIPCFSADQGIKTQAEKTEEYLLGKVKRPGIGDRGGDWVVMAMARGEVTVPADYYETYYRSLVDYLESGSGVLAARKYTEYSRTVVALSAIGADPSDVGGYDLLTYLADFNAVKWQGLNGPVWALIALDSGNYEIPENKAAEVRATRRMYIDYILSKQLDDGGFNLSGNGNADVDITAMTLQALAKYMDLPEVKAAAAKALEALSSVMNERCTFSYYGTENCESVAQVIVALCELGIGLDDQRFVRGNKNLADGLLSFALSDGSFRHLPDGDSNQMATEQACYAMIALQRFNEGRSSLYRMGDAKKLVGEADIPEFGLAGKDPDVKQMPVTGAGVSFSDISANSAKAAIEGLASRGIISGMGEGTFKPEETMTRAQFATIVTLGLGLSAEKTTAFSDIRPTAWYAGFVGAANKYGIVSGRSESSFDPEATITKQEAAIMVARAARLCGMDIDMDATATRNVLAQFGDYTMAAPWAQPFLAFCYSADILDQSELDIYPLRKVTRAEIAQMIYNMLGKARLL